jgi:hypothetical protein
MLIITHKAARVAPKIEIYSIFFLYTHGPEKKKSRAHIRTPAQRISLRGLLWCARTHLSTAAATDAV